MWLAGCSHVSHCNLGLISSLRSIQHYTWEDADYRYVTRWVSLRLVHPSASVIQFRHAPSVWTGTDLARFQRTTCIFARRVHVKSLPTLFADDVRRYHGSDWRGRSQAIFIQRISVRDFIIHSIPKKMIVGYIINGQTDCFDVQIEGRRFFE